MENEKVTENVKVTANFEQTQVPLRAEIEHSDQIEQQIKDDDRIIPNIGDERIMVQQGKIISPDGSQVIETDLTIVRKREANHGVSVTVIVPALGLAGD